MGKEIRKKFIPPQSVVDHLKDIDGRNIKDLICLVVLGYSRTALCMDFFRLQNFYIYRMVKDTGEGIPTTPISDSFTKGNETDHVALLAIKAKITSDPHRVLSSWNESTNFCLWEGVTCGRRHKRVTVLNLTEKELVGSLSPFVGNLSFLHALILTNNTFSGHIPPEVGRLSRLQTLNLYHNSFEQKIPANISRCMQLKNLELGYNKLTGDIPSQLSLLSKLEVLGLDCNNLTGDNLSPLSNLTSLTALYLSGRSDTEGPSGFRGRIPNFIGKFKDLQVLALGGNSFSGEIPPSLYDLSKIQKLSLNFNQLTGSLPSNLGFYFPQLRWFQIGDNQLSGAIPISLSNLSNLEYLSLVCNDFTGKFMLDERNMKNLSQVLLYDAIHGRGEADDLSFIDNLVNCSRFEILLSSGNYFGGMLPLSVANQSTKLRWLDLSSNQLSGNIPLGMSSLLNLQYLHLNDNRFTGTIPADIGKMTRLQETIFSNNQLFGSIPLSLGNLSLLSKLDLSNNKFQGTVPATLGNCNSLLYLYLSHNNLVGNVPYQLFQASELLHLFLDHNHLQGSLPSEIGGLKNLVTVNLSNNNFSGTIPTSLSECVALTNLSLKGNSFSGFIPPSFSHLEGLHIVDLSSNKLAGQVPEYFFNFSSMVLLNLSFNNLEGGVPTKGVFANLSAISIVGNPKLCGGIPQLKLPSCPTLKGKRKPPAVVIVAVSIVACVFVGVAIVTSLYLICTKRRSKASVSGLLFKEPFIKVSYDMLLKATDGFSTENMIGSGSFGAVYKGTLLEGVKKVVAIKVINNQRRGACKSFVAECEALRIIRHRNLVGVITACSSIGFQGNVFKALVYELMSNGSLERWLHSNPEEDVQYQNLTLQQRLNIAIDLAHALDYIHNGIGTSIIHCDLKPSNILLDDDMTSHVGDFGLVKLIPEISEQLYNSSSVGVRGTVGYTAPEYGLGSSVSAAGDLYSYGIILLEMMTGKKPTDLIFEGDMSLHKFAELGLADHLLEIIDPKLKFDDVEERNMDLYDRRPGGITKCVFDCIATMIMIGVKCSSELPQDRMDIKDVIGQLHSQRDHILLCGRRHRCQLIL
ncbi:probable LRR receptor-like serine/threonine-protein kinase At3g47570 [Chenopodium quinoa]|uniref:probable LRR receptor-like serine/threonine-protein kinase At3g47570 n=1 Tax=Chenopodium quinoa TaxID=63459 RepID=UPI000B76FB80|nr:probable LRR receptor-like serine/threonine-protein kinase At3g47570 [Chenopodium quinoa]